MMLQSVHNFRLGFSLVELVVVVAILGLLASGGMLVLSGELRKAQRAASLNSFVDLHDRACRSCIQTGVPVLFDLEQKSVVFELPSGPRTLMVPAMQQIVMGGAILDRGTVMVEYSGGGPPGYAMMLSSSKTTKCLLVHAGTGLISRLDKKQVDASYISTWQTAWANTR